MRRLSLLFAALCLVLLMVGCTAETPVVTPEQTQDGSVALGKKALDDDKKVSRAELVVFQSAGEYGGGVLEPGTMFPPTGPGFSTLRRDDDGLSYNIHTTGLPPGAYTNWWVIFNNPEGCDGDCDETDLFNPDTNPSVFWATGGIVEEDSVGNFNARIGVGELPQEPDQHVLGPGLVAPQNAEGHLIVKYHGPASEDPEELYLQTHTLTGLCDSGANAHDLGAPFGVQCFDPQVAVHKRAIHKP